jgi:hypothetical protein
MGRDDLRGSTSQKETGCSNEMGPTPDNNTSQVANNGRDGRRWYIRTQLHQ